MVAAGDRTASASSYTIVPGGAPVTVTTTAASENATATFAGTAGRSISLKISGVTISSALVSILKPDGTTLVAASSLGTAGKFIDRTSLPVSGTYKILIDPQGTVIGSATLTLYDVPADVTGSIIPGGAAASVTTTVPGQNAKVTFAGTAGRRVSLKVGPTCCSLKVSILKPDTTALVTATAISATGGFLDVKTLPSTGTYTIVVDPQSSAAGATTVTLYDVPADIGGSITPGGPSVTFTTSVPGQNVRATFAGTVGQRVSVKVQPTCCASSVTILRPDGTTVGALTTVAATGGFVDARSLSLTGTYTILVDNQAAAVGAVTLTLYAVPADVTGSITPGGAAVSVTTTVPGQNAKVTFAGTAGRRVSLKVGPTCCSLKVSILKPDGTALVAATAITASGGFIDVKTLAVSGTYSIVVDPQGSVVGATTLTLYDVPADVTGSIVPGGAAVTMTLGTPGRNGKLTFTGVAGRGIALQLSAVTIGSSTTASLKLSILKPDGTSLLAPTLYGTNGAFIDTMKLPVGGTYSIVVDPQSSATGSATLTLYDVAPDLAATIVPGGASVSLTFTTAYQNGRVTFAGTAGERVSLKMAFAPTACCTVNVSIFNPSGSRLVAPVAVAAGENFIDGVTLPVTGTYSILVDPYQAATGMVTLTLYDLPPDVTASATLGGPPVTVTTAAAGQNARVTFVGAAGDGVIVKLGPGNCCNVAVSVLKPDGTTLVGATMLGTTGGSIYARLPVAGTYTVLIDYVASATGSVTVQLIRDNTPPTAPALSLAATTPDGFVQGRTFFYRPAGTGGVTVTATTTDAGSGISKVTFPGLSGGFTPTALTSDFTSPYLLTYNWNPGATFSGAANTVTAYDNLGNTSAATFAMVPDAAAPTTTDNTASIGSAWKTTNQTVTLTPSDGAGSGVAATHYTTDGSTPTSSSPVGTSISLTTDGVFTIKYFSTDNVTNAEAVKTAGTQIRIDKTAPSSAVLTALPASIKNGQVLTASAADSTSGVASVSYFYCAGAACTPSILIGSSSTGPNYSVTWNSQPADGTYQVLARVADVAGNTRDSAKQTITIDNTLPAAPAITANPPNPSNSAAPSFSFTGEAGATFQCSLDGGAFSACTSPKAYSGLAAGSHTFLVRQTDTAANTGPNASYTWTIDLTAPAAPVITSNPPALTNSNAASFSFTGEAGATFGCQLDGGGFSACASPKTYSGLTAGSHTFQVRQTDAAGNTGVAASFTWTIDLTAPAAPAITANPPALTTSNSASFSFTGEAGATFACQLDGAGFSACTSPKAYSALADGSHTFQVRQTDTAGNTGPNASYTWTVDTTPPAAPAITANPPNPSNSTAPSFSFTGEAGATFQCSLDGGAFSACTSPKAYSGLTAGSHTFQVRQTDSAGLTGPNASYTWTIDLTAPAAPVITANPNNPTNSTAPSFSFTGEAGASFACQLDGAGFSACTSPKAYSGLASGSHTFLVRQTDTAGNTGPNASYTWTIDLTAPAAPSITGNPTNPTSATSASFSFTGEAGASFECKLDGGAFGACTSPKAYAALADGSHTFAVRQTDTAGNTSPNASYAWTVDTTPPAAPAITANPTNPTNSTAASFSFSGEAGGSFSCQLDGGGFSACTSPKIYSGLAESSHTFQVRQTDGLGNTGVAASFTWTIDLTAPAAPVITSNPPALTNSNAASVSFTGEAGASFGCQLDGGGFSACASPKTYSGLTAGSHTFQVQQTDMAGNTGPAANYAWTIDTAAPDTSIDSMPPDPSTPDVTFDFSASEGGSTFECSLDGGAFGACSSPTSYSSLASGPHTFGVRATDPAGNTDPTPATFSWTVS
jgi:hypothetical protein